MQEVNLPLLERAEELLMPWPTLTLSMRQQLKIKGHSCGPETTIPSEAITMHPEITTNLEILDSTLWGWANLKAGKRLKLATLLGDSLKSRNRPVLPAILWQLL
ncbi:unnamed protein product, partial [Dovyalis caffra]